MTETHSLQRAAAKILRMKRSLRVNFEKEPAKPLSIGDPKPKSNMALILRHPLSAMAIRSLRPPSSNRNIFLNQSMLQSGKGVGRLFSSNGSVQITYIDQGGKEHSVNADIGKSLMDIAHDNNIELEGNAVSNKHIFI